MNTVLETKYQQFTRELDSIWTPVGDITQPPKALKRNLRVYMSKEENQENDRLHTITEREIVKTIFMIEGASKLIDRKEDPVARKAEAFLKRTAHDRTFEKTQFGAYKLHEAVTKSGKTEKKTDFRKEVCEPDCKSHRWEWELMRLQSQAELAEVGKKLDLCVQSRHGEGEIYHDQLYNCTREFWKLCHHSSVQALIEINPDGEDGGREIEEMQGAGGKDIKLEQEIANFVLQSLDVVCYHPFIQLGAFLEFANETFSYEDPADIREDDNHVFYSWFSTSHVIVAKLKKEIETYEHDLLDNEFEDEFEEDDEGSAMTIVTLDEYEEQQEHLDQWADEEFELNDEFEEDEESELDEDDNDFSNPFDAIETDEAIADPNIQWYRLNLKEDPW